MRNETGEERLPHYSRIGLWVAAAFATALALTKRSVIDLWHDLGSVTTPALLLPVALGLLGRGGLGPGWTLTAMVVPFLVTLLWIAAKAFPRPGLEGSYPWGIEPIYAGLATSLIVYVAGWTFGTRRSRIAFTAMPARKTAFWMRESLAIMRVPEGRYAACCRCGV